MTENRGESAADRAIREALESVERLEREARAARSAEAEAANGGDLLDADAVELLPPSEIPPSGDPSDEGGEPDPAANDAEDPRRASQKSSGQSAQNTQILEAMIHAKQQAQEALAQTQREAKDLFDRLARVSADFENFKKRMTKEKQDAIKFANEGLLKEFLPVVDNMRRAMAAATDTSDKTLLEGIGLVAKQFDDVLHKSGVAGYDALGQPFDPARHEAIGMRPDAKIPAQYVAEEFQRGYLLNDRLLRPALVIVSTGPE